MKYILLLVLVVVYIEVERFLNNILYMVYGILYMLWYGSNVTIQCTILVLYYSSTMLVL